MDENIVGGSFVLDTSDLKKGLEAANRAIRVSNSEFQAAAAGMGDWTKSEEGLNAKMKQLTSNIDVQKQKVAALQKEYEAVAKEKGANSKEAQNLQIRVNNETKALKESEAELDKTANSLKNFGKETKNADDSTNKFTDGLKSLGSVAGKALVGLGAAATGLVAGFLALGETTQDTIEDMGKLEAAFTSSGHSAETGQKAYQGFVGILGETDQSVEAVNHLAKLTKSEEELAQWTDIAAGIYGTFGDSLPIEGLTEAANETAKVGQVTGPLADALNWAGISEEKFNEELAKCNSEQERATLITNTLNATYKEAADAYKTVNADLIANREATANMNTAMAELGKVALPITTALKESFTDLINSLLPGMQLFGEGIKGLISGTAGAGEQVSSGISSIVSGLTQKLTEVIPLISNVATALIPALLNGIISGLPALGQAATDIIIMLAEELVKALPQLTNVAIQIILTLINGIIEALPTLLVSMTDVVLTIIDSIVGAIPLFQQATIQFLMAMVQAIPQIVQLLSARIPEIINTFIFGILNALPQLLAAAIQLLMAIVNAIPVIIQSLIVELPTIINTIIEAVLEALPLLLDAAVQLFMALIQAIPTIIAALIENLPTIITTITETLLKNLPKLIEAAVKLFMGIIKAIPQITGTLIKSMPQIIKAIVSGLGNGLSSMIKIGGDLLKGVWEGLKGAKDWLLEKVKSLMGSITDGIKSFFGIKSPSRVFRDEIGKQLALGIGVGFEDEMDSVKKGIIKSADIVGDINSSLGTPQFGGVGINSGSAVNENVINFTQNNYSPKSLRRVDIWRNTRNAIASVGR